MPPLPRIRDPELAAIAADLRFSSRAAILRDIERAEALAAEIDPEAAYPAEWVVFRVTGYRPEHAGEAIIEGRGLRADLSAFVERLCARARLGPDECPEGSLGLDELAEQLGVSRKTVDRWRRDGLVARRVRTASGPQRLLVTPATLEAFRATHAAAIRRAARASRLDPATADRMIRRAARYRRTLGCSRNQAAARLSRRFGRSLEGVRQLLERHDAAERGRPGGRPIFDPPRRLDGRQRAAALRASLRGGAWPDVARAMGEPEATTRRTSRVTLAARVRLLRRLDLGAPVAPARRGSPPEEALASDHARRGLGLERDFDTLRDQLEAARAGPPPDSVAERTRAIAMHTLRARAGERLASLGDLSRAAVAVDEIETMLRWAGLLRAGEGRGQVGTVVKALDAMPGGRGALPPAAARSLVVHAVAETGRSVDRFAPYRGARLAGSVSLALGPIVARAARGASDSTRAGHTLTSAAPVDTLAMRPSLFWRPTLTPPLFVRRASSATIGPDHARVLRARWGLGGDEPPSTLAALAEAMGTTRMRAAMAERAALRAAHDAAPPASPEPGVLGPPRP